MINTLIPIIEGLPDPLDFKDEHHTWLSPLKLKSTASSHPEFIQLVDQFESIAHAQLLATQWLWQYNNERPHTAIGGIPPRQLLMAA